MISSLLSKVQSSKHDCPIFRKQWKNFELQALSKTCFDKLILLIFQLIWHSFIYSNHNHTWRLIYQPLCLEGFFCTVSPKCLRNNFCSQGLRFQYSFLYLHTWVFPGFWNDFCNQRHLLKSDREGQARLRIFCHCVTQQQHYKKRWHLKTFHFCHTK